METFDFLMNLPNKVNALALEVMNTCFHFDLEGEGGGQEQEEREARGGAHGLSLPRVGLRAHSAGTSLGEVLGLLLVLFLFDGELGLVAAAGLGLTFGHLNSCGGAGAPDPSLPQRRARRGSRATESPNHPTLTRRRCPRCRQRRRCRRGRPTA